MKTTKRKVIEAEFLAAIEKDLAAARREGRFEDALHHLDEIFVIHLHTDSESTRLRCSALIAAPEALQQAA